MSSQKLIVVLGATGNQGGSVVQSFLEEPGWTIRAITRNPASAKAQALARLGVQVVQADTDDASTLTSAFQGAHAIFAVSDFWGIYASPATQDKPGPRNAWAFEKESQQLKNMIDAAAKVQDLERFVVSALSNATKWSQGKYTHVYHFDSKAQAIEYGQQRHPELWAKTSVFQAGFFLSNFVNDPVARPTLNEQGTAQFISALAADTALPFIVPDEDSGPLVKRLVLEAPGKNLIAYREWLTLQQLADIFSQATGYKTDVVQLPYGEFRGPLPDDLRLELADNFAYWNEFGYEGRHDATVMHPKALEEGPELPKVVDYLKKQNWARLLAE